MRDQHDNPPPPSPVAVELGNVVRVGEPQLRAGGMENDRIT